MSPDDNISLLIRSTIEKQAHAPPGSLWDCLLLVTLTSLNHCHHTPNIYNLAASKLPLSRSKLYQRYHDALTKILIIVGMPKTLNAFFLLTSVLTDENLVDIKPRDFSHTEASAERLNAYGSTTHGESFQGMTEMARKFLPDLGYISFNVSMEHILSDCSVHNAVATMVLLITVLVCMDCPLQAAWHVKGYVRHGGRKEDVHEVVEFAKEIAGVAGVELKNLLPGVEEVLAQDQWIVLDEK